MYFASVLTLLGHLRHDDDNDDEKDEILRRAATFAEWPTIGDDRAHPRELTLGARGASFDQSRDLLRRMRSGGAFFARKVGGSEYNAVQSKVQSPTLSTLGTLGTLCTLGTPG